jgi:hypothetical protein
VISTISTLGRRPALSRSISRSARAPFGKGVPRELRHILLPVSAQFQKQV